MGKKPTPKDIKFKKELIKFWDSNKDANDILSLLLVFQRVIAPGDGLSWKQVVEILEEVTEEPVGLMLCNGDGSKTLVGHG